MIFRLPNENTVALGLGQKEEAIAWLQQAYEQRDFRMTTLSVDFGFDSLRSDPRFVELERKIGLPE